MTPAVDPNHPTDETLAAFVDDRLDAARRAEVIRHLTGCAECRDVAAAASELRADEGAGRVVQGRFGVRVLGATAAALAAAVVLVVFLADPFARAGIGELVEASDSLQYRRAHGRISGGFPYKPPRPAMRSGAEETFDARERKLWEAAGRIQNSEPPDFHARGVVQLLLGNSAAAADALERAHEQSPDDAQVATDLAAALIARGRERRSRADLERALALSERTASGGQNAEAAWNRALALESLERTDEARRAWDDYLRLDPNGPWASEARGRRDALR
jgi:tetratricopeptide (TPR) repeat protein